MTRECTGCGSHFCDGVACYTEEPVSDPLRHLEPAVDYSGMEPRQSPLQPIFRDHNCGGCDSGAKPCLEGNYNNCSNPRARND